MSRVRVFIGSSAEAMHIADALQSGFDSEAYEVTIWEDAFVVGAHTLDELQRAVAEHHVGVFILNDDDETLSRGKLWLTTRDNVLFEAGMFSGDAGPPRSFLVTRARHGVKVPSDLAGVVLATYSPPDDADSKNHQGWRSALRPAAKKIEEAIERYPQLAKLRASTGVVELASMTARELERLRSGVERLTSSFNTPFEEHVDTTYFVGEDPADDRIVVERETIPEQTMYWRRIFLGSDATSVPADDQLRLAVVCGGQTMDAVRVREHDHSVDCVIFFTRPIQAGERRRWRVEHHWPGFWNPLRDGDIDHAYTQLPFPGEVSFRFVHDAKRRLEVVKSDPADAKATRSTLKSGRSLKLDLGRVEISRARIDLRFAGG